MMVFKGLITIVESQYLLILWSTVLLEKLTGFAAKLIKKFPTFYGTPKFITVLTSVRHLLKANGNVKLNIELLLSADAIHHKGSQRTRLKMRKTSDGHKQSCKKRFP